MLYGNVCRNKKSVIVGYADAMRLKMNFERKSVFRLKHYLKEN